MKNKNELKEIQILFGDSLVGIENVNKVCLEYQTAYF